MFRYVLCFFAVATIGLCQSPEYFFRTGGANFRDTAPEQRLYWQPHIDHSYRRILEAADLAQGKHVATVLGAGVAAEIPLAELARRFDRLILVDMDGLSMVEGIEQVPLELRSKVEIKVMDVTSFATLLMQHLAEAADASSSASDCFRRFGVIFSDLAPGQPVNLPPSDLVVSSLVLSEIPRYPFSYADRLMQAHYNVPLDSWPEFNTAFQKLASVAIEDHARLLTSLLRPGGVVYYADTIARGPAYGKISAETRGKVDAAALPDFRRLGLAETAAGVDSAVSSLCEAEHPVKSEVKAYEQLLTAYLQIAPGAFEPLLPIAEVERKFEQHGLTPAAPPETWYWLSYPCAIATSPGAFYVRNVILRQAAAK